jgi:hypothetical protein
MLHRRHARWRALLISALATAALSVAAPAASALHHDWDCPSQASSVNCWDDGTPWHSWVQLAVRTSATNTPLVCNRAVMQNNSQKVAIFGTNLCASTYTNWACIYASPLSRAYVYWHGPGYSARKIYGDAYTASEVFECG